MKDNILAFVWIAFIVLVAIPPAIRGETGVPAMCVAYLCLMREFFACSRDCDEVIKIARKALALVDIASGRAAVTGKAEAP